jgi:glutathione S-transferase
MNKIKFIATPLSHYGRKVRILLDLYQLSYDFIDVGNISDINKTQASIGNNPMMKVPILQHGDDWLIESDHISSFLVNNYDKKDIYKVNSMEIIDLNIKAMLNTIMTEEVKVIVAKRQQVPIENYLYFNKSVEVVENGLQWLELNHTNFDAKSPKYKEFHLVCAWDHLKYYDFISKMINKYPNLNQIVNRVSEFKVIKQSAPQIVIPK